MTKTFATAACSRSASPDTLSRRKRNGSSAGSGSSCAINDAARRLVRSSRKTYTSPGLIRLGSFFFSCYCAISDTD